MIRRHRVLYCAVIAGVVVMGLASRRHTAVLPAFIAQYAGDTLWALTVFLGIAFLATRWSTFRVAAIALVVSYSLEVSQLYHAAWIDSIRKTRLGGLILGYGFLWSDIACYTVGVALGFVLDLGLHKAAERR